MFDDFAERHGHLYDEDLAKGFRESLVAEEFTAIALAARRRGYHLYLMLGEYDNFTNAMLHSKERVQQRHGAIRPASCIKPN